MPEEYTDSGAPLGASSTFFRTLTVIGHTKMDYAYEGIFASKPQA